MSYKKRVGDLELEVWDDGSPPWCFIRHGTGGEIQHLQPDDLRDLRYAIDRALAHLGLE